MFGRLSLGSLTLGSAGIVVSAGDVTAPTIVSTSPTDDATDVAIGVNPTVTFDEPVAFGTGNITLRDVTAGTNVEVFDVEVNTGGGAGTVSISGDTLTIEPTSDLSNSNEYAIQIDATAIDDTSGNSFAGISDDTTFSWTTVAAFAVADQTYSAGDHTQSGVIVWTFEATSGTIASIDSLSGPNSTDYSASLNGSTVEISANVNGPANGPYSLSLTCYDGAGQTGNSDVVTLTGNAETNTWQAYTHDDLVTVLEHADLALGDKVWLTGEDYNSGYTANSVRRTGAVNLAGGAFGTNWVDIEPDALNPVTPKMWWLQISGGGGVADHGFRFQNINAEYIETASLDSTGFIFDCFQDISYIQLKNVTFDGSAVTYSKGDGLTPNFPGLFGVSGSTNGGCIADSLTCTDHHFRSVSFTGPDCVIKNCEFAKPHFDSCNFAGKFARAEFRNNKIYNKEALTAGYSITNIVDNMDGTTTVTVTAGGDISGGAVAIEHPNWNQARAESVTSTVDNMDGTHDITFGYDSSGDGPYTSGGTLYWSDQHADGLQFITSGLASPGDGDDVKIIANELRRGVGTSQFNAMQCYFMNNTSGVDCDGWFVLGNVAESDTNHGISFNNITNALISGCTSVPPDGHTGQNCDIRIPDNSDNTIEWCISCAYDLGSNEDYNNKTITAGDTTAFAANFENPKTLDSAYAAGDYLTKAGSPAATDFNTIQGANSTYISYTGDGSYSVPVVLDTQSPADDATGIPANNNIIGTFNTWVAAGSGNWTLRKNDGGWTNVEQIAVGSLTISGRTVTFDPTSDMASLIEHAMRIDATAIDGITEVGAQSYAGIANDTDWSWTTEEANNFPNYNISDISTYSGNFADTHSVPYATNISVGDLLLFPMGCRNASDAFTTAPGSFTEQVQGSATGQSNLAVFAEDAGSAYTGNVTVDPVDSERINAIMVRISNWRGTLGTDIEFSSIAYATGEQTITIPSITPSWGSEDTLYISIVMNQPSQDGAGYAGTPSGWSDATSIETANLGKMGIAFKKSTATSEGGSETWDVGEENTDNWAAVTCAVRQPA